MIEVADVAGMMNAAKVIGEMENEKLLNMLATGQTA